MNDFKAKCEECGKRSPRLAMRDEDGALVCYKCILKSKSLTKVQREHYTELIKK